MSEQEKCPKCGADGDGYQSECYDCDSYTDEDGNFVQDPKCRIAELTQQLATATRWLDQSELTVGQFVYQDEHALCYVMHICDHDLEWFRTRSGYAGWRFFKLPVDDGRESVT